MATSESALAFVPRRVKPSASRPPPPSASGRHRAVPSSDDQTTSYPRDVLLKVTLKENECRGKARNSPQRIKAQSRRVLERLVSHSVDYVYVEQAARVLEANAEDEKLERKDLRIVVRTPSSSCAQALLAALIQRNYKAEMLTSDDQADHWRGVPGPIKNRARGRSERGAYALRKSRAAASQQRSRRR